MLVPLSLKLTSEQMSTSAQREKSLARFGLQFKPPNHRTLIVLGVPSPLGQQSQQRPISDLRSYS
ncbi:hypothetical protein UF06_22245, partial [Vibrio sp. S234-5]